MAKKNEAPKQTPNPKTFNRPIPIGDSKKHIEEIRKAMEIPPKVKDKDNK